jgi:hypothetical protein
VGLHSLLIHSPKTIKYFTYTGLSVSYFLLVAFATFMAFLVYDKYQVSDRKTRQIKWILVSFAVFIGVNPIVNAYIPASPELVEYLKDMHFYYPLFYYSSTFIKIADITFQQILIFIFLRKMKRLSGGDLEFSVLIFGFCFFLLHVPLFYLLKWAAFAFVIPCLFAGFIFSYFSLYYKRSGLVWSFVIHELFYVVMGVLFRLLY